MIYLIGEAPLSVSYQQRNFVQFLLWERMQKSYQLDIETNYTEWWCTKKLISIQFGSIDGTEQWVIQWSALTEEAKGYIKKILEDKSKCKLIHNAMFEAVVLLFHNIRIVNVYDTMLVEMILFCGMMFKEDEVDDDESEEAAGFYALTSLTHRYLQYGMDKTEQLNFGDDILTESKVKYAAADVVPLAAIRATQVMQLHQYDLEYVAALENEVVLAYAEMTYYGMELDAAAWRTNIDLAMPLIQQAKKELDEWLTQDPFKHKAVELGYLNDKDRCIINWNSPAQKKQVVEHFFPFLQDKVSKPVLTRLLKIYDKDGTHPFTDDRAMEWVRAFAEGNWDKIEKACIELDRPWLVEHELMIPGGQSTINWNSRDQVLILFKVINPKMGSLDKESMSKFLHPIGRSLEKYKDTLKLITTYGEAFISGTKKKRGSVEPDGKVRTSFNQIVSTGRVSCRKPNMQNIPAKESVGTRYRNAFVCDKGWKYVDSDFSSQELVIIAYMSNDPVWNEALRLGQDLHSVCAELVYPNQGWKNAAQADCTYYQQTADHKIAKAKCSCKAHKNMRNGVKTINFGLAYGMSEYKLSGELNIDVKSAKKLIQDYFKAFPSIGGTLGYLGNFGVRNGYIQTIAPFFRKRWFPYWRYSRSKVDAHIAKIQYDATLGSIERASKNMPIQGTAGDMAKLSLLMLYNFIHDNDLSDRVKLVMQVHDQNTTIVRDDYTEEWKTHMDRIMREAAAFIIPNGLLGAETTISPCWTK